MPDKSRAFPLDWARPAQTVKKLCFLAGLLLRQKNTQRFDVAQQSLQ